MTYITRGNTTRNPAFSQGYLPGARNPGKFALARSNLS